MSGPEEILRLRAHSGKGYFLLIAAALFSNNLFAQAGELENIAALNGLGSGFGAEGLTRVVLALAFIVVLIFILSALLKKFELLPGSGSSIIKIVSGISLGNRDKLLLVQVGEEQILLSTSPGRICKLHKLEQNVVEENADQGSRGEKKFSKLLESVTVKMRQ